MVPAPLCPQSAAQPASITKATRVTRVRSVEIIRIPLPGNGATISQKKTDFLWYDGSHAREDTPAGTLGWHIPRAARRVESLRRLSPGDLGLVRQDGHGPLDLTPHAGKHPDSRGSLLSRA